MKWAGWLLALFCIQACASADSTSAEEDTTRLDSVQASKKGTVVCFVYHRFGDERFPSTNISLEDFEAHLQYLKANDYQVLTLAGAIEYLQSGNGNRKTVAITVDDGYHSFYENALPLLKKYGFPASLFINTETVSGGDYMDWAQIQDAHEQGIEIGNHTHTHDYFLNLPKEERYEIFEKEIELSQGIIKEKLGFQPVTFAYPYGELDEQMKKIVQGHGFKGAAAQNSGVMHSKSDFFRLPRFPMSEAYANPEKFYSKASMQPLVIKSENPTSFLIPNNEPAPELKLTLDAANIRLKQLQCFIQGSESTISFETDQTGETVISVEPLSSINHRRRTLYTITVPDNDGNWHWYSHLWINPEIR